MSASSLLTASIPLALGLLCPLNHAGLGGPPRYYYRARQWVLFIVVGAIAQLIRAAAWLTPEAGGLGRDQTGNLLCALFINYSYGTRECTLERLIDTLASYDARFKKAHAVFVGIVAALRRLHEVTVLEDRLRVQVALCGHKYPNNVLRTVLLDLRHPTVQVQEGTPTRGVVGQEDAVATTKVLHREVAVQVLAGGIPDLDLYSFFILVHQAGLHVYARMQRLYLGFGYVAPRIGLC